MKPGGRVAVGLVAGYFLGRTRKMRLALMLAAAGATGKLGSPGELAQRGVKMLASSPEVAKIGQTVRGELVDALKAAAVTAASSRIDSLSDRLQGQVVAGKPTRPEAGEEETERPPERARARAEDEEVGRAQGEEGEPEAAEREEPEEPAVARQRRAPADETAARRRPRGESAEYDDRASTRGRGERMGSGTGRAPVRRR
jgi:hypothetical protein